MLHKTLETVAAAALSGMMLAGALLAAPGMAGTPTGHAATWGYNVHGQLGDNSTADAKVPVAVDTTGALAGKTLTAISTGLHHTCAVADGRAHCWGFNGFGQLGDNGTADAKVPVAVDTTGVLAGKTLTAIGTGFEHSCAVADGAAYCWGENSNGQLGNNTAIGSTVPVAVDTTGVLNGRTVTAIDAGLAHTCAVADGRAYCWGYNGYGELGINSTIGSKVPVAVSTTGPLNGKAVTAISLGGHDTCAVADGTASCWGYNSSGQLGNNTTTDAKVPVPVNTTGPLNGRTVTAIAAGSIHTCAMAEGRASCWGYNGDGRLGNNSTTDSTVPVPVDNSGVLAGKTMTGISAGGFHTCAMAESNAYCWGDNYFGQLGDNSTTNIIVPMAVNTDGVLAGKGITAIATGGNHTAVLFAVAPQPPTAVFGVAGDGQVTVSWTAPADDGGSPIQTYTATAAPGGAACTTASTSCVVTGLTNGTGYTFTVTATNAVGTSAPSAPSGPVTPSAPAPPVQPTATVKGLRAKFHNGTVKITWKKVAGATSYRVRISKPGGKKYKAWNTTTKRVFKAKVKKGKKYRFQVAAVVPGGQGRISTIRFKGK
jgi:alpha-tubulin suppressor-like RCC1 family protein